MSGRGKKLSYDKNTRANVEWMKSKRVGHPKQQWVEATIHGRAIPAELGLAGIEALINEQSIAAYVPAHWEKL